MSMLTQDQLFDDKGRIQADDGFYTVRPNGGNFDICQSRHKGQDTSVAANPPRHSKVAHQKLILEALGRVGEASCERLEGLTFSSHQSTSARISELARDGKIEICGKAKTRSGRDARVYRLIKRSFNSGVSY